MLFVVISFVSWLIIQFFFLIASSSFVFIFSFFRGCEFPFFVICWSFMFLFFAAILFFSWYLFFFVCYLLLVLFFLSWLLVDLLVFHYRCVSSCSLCLYSVARVFLDCLFIVFVSIDIWFSVCYILLFICIFFLFLIASSSVFPFFC